MACIYSGKWRRLDGEEVGSRHWRARSIVRAADTCARPAHPRPGEVVRRDERHGPAVSVPAGFMACDRCVGRRRPCHVRPVTSLRLVEWTQPCAVRVANGGGVRLRRTARASGRSARRLGCVARRVGRTLAASMLATSGAWTTVG